MNEPVRFDDGAAYERFMGKWSHLVGGTFLEWLAPEPGLRWLDVGCGNGAFTEMFVERCAPASVKGIDPSDGQLTYARTRPALSGVEFLCADAMALPFPDDAFDVAVMPLVIFFVPDPAKGVAEMVRAVSPGGMVAAYAWDMEGGGFPYDLLRSEMSALGVEFSGPPSPEASGLDAMKNLWAGAGVESVETRQITAQRTFADFDDYWKTILAGPRMGARLAAMAPDSVALLSDRLHDRLSNRAAGPFTCSARANAVKGRVA